MLMKENVGVGHRILLGKRLAVLIGELNELGKLQGPCLDWPNHVQSTNAAADEVFMAAA